MCGAWGMGSLGQPWQARGPGKFRAWVSGWEGRVILELSRVSVQGGGLEAFSAPSGLAARSSLSTESCTCQQQVLRTGRHLGSFKTAIDAPDKLGAHPVYQALARGQGDWQACAAYEHGFCSDLLMGHVIVMMK